MNLNSILIGSEEPKRLVGVLHEALRRAGWDEGGYTGWQIGNGGSPSGPTTR